MLLNLKNLQNMHYAWNYSPIGQNIQTCTEKESKFVVVKSSNVYLQNLRSVTCLYKNMHLHGNPGSNDETWIRLYTPELKRQLSKWRHTESHLFRAVSLNVRNSESIHKILLFRDFQYYRCIQQRLFNNVIQNYNCHH